MRRRRLLSHLRAHGCVFVREGRRHSVWANPANNTQTVVPRHTEIREIMVRKICRDLDILRP
ncbi:MAG: type II toxin-antitoxin system HicA family toxin [Dehalococcoidia bacterium]|nr:type II toxin-antitoxin system HicA family toxin [Dehalococcoidia bacterium]